MAARRNGARSGRADHTYTEVTFRNQPALEQRTTFTGADEQLAVRLWSQEGNLLRESVTDLEREVAEREHRYEGLRRIKPAAAVAVELPEQRFDTSCLETLTESAPWAEVAPPFSCAGTDCGYLR